MQGPLLRGPPSSPACHRGSNIKYAVVTTVTTPTKVPHAVEVSHLSRIWNAVTCLCKPGIVQPTTLSSRSFFMFWTYRVLGTLHH